MSTRGEKTFFGLNDGTDKLRRVVETRRRARITIEVDLPDIDYREIIIPGIADEPPTERVEIVESNVVVAISGALNGLDIDLHALSLRLGAVQEYKSDDVLA